MDRRKTIKLMSVAAVCMFVYVAAKAWRLGITWDEAFSYLEFIVPGHLYPGAGGGMAANNHLLNSWLTFFTARLFGPSEFALRLPSVVSFAAYLYFVGRFALTLENRWASVPVFLLFTCNPYLVDFFALSRGYGLSFALLAGSVWYVIRYSRHTSRGDFSRSLILAMLAVTANLALLPFAMVLYLVPAMVHMTGAGRRQGVRAAFGQIAKANPKWLNVMFLVFLACFTIYGLVLQFHGALFYGGKDGFFSDTVCTVLDRTLYDQPYAGWMIDGLLAFGALVCVAVILSALPSARSAARPRHAVLCFLLGGCISMILAQHYLLGTLFLIERSALYLFVLSCFVIITTAEHFASRHGFVMVIPALLGAGMAFHFVRSADLRYVLEWKRDADVPAMIRDLDSLRMADPGARDRIQVGASLEFEQPFNYYIRRDSLAWLKPFDRNDRTARDMDYYILDRHDFEADSAGYRFLKYYPISEASLLAR